MLYAILADRHVDPDYLDSINPSTDIEVLIVYGILSYIALGGFLLSINDGPKKQRPLVNIRTVVWGLCLALFLFGFSVPFWPSRLQIWLWG